MAERTTKVSAINFAKLNYTSLKKYANCQDRHVRGCRPVAACTNETNNCCHTLTAYITVD